MKKTRISDFWFYKFRYQIGYFAFLAGYLAILFYAIFVAPNGLTQNEISSATKSANFSFGNILSSEIIDFPFKILQKISIDVLGLSIFSIKLPAILLSILALGLIILLSKKWFPGRIVVMSAIIAITSSQFFFLAQNGTSEILYALYPTALILVGLEFLRKPQKWHAPALAAIIGLSLYTPMSIYILIALVATIFSHPHLRFEIIKKTSQKQKAIGAGLASIIILPLLIAIFKDFSITKQIAGLPDNFNLLGNFGRFIGLIFGLHGQSGSGTILPIINLSALMLIAIGLYFTLIERHSARSYLINIWMAILTIVCIINPNSVAILFVPILILTVSGLQNLIQTWYAIFPRNPYARVAGLIPTVILVGGMFLTNLNIFRRGYLYNPDLVANFSQDLKLLREQTDSGRNLIADESEKPFYQILEKQKKASVSSEFNGQKIVVITKQAFDKKTIPSDYKITKVIASSRTENADRFYVLTKK